MPASAHRWFCRGQPAKSLRGRAGRNSSARPPPAILLRTVSAVRDVAGGQIPHRRHRSKTSRRRKGQLTPKMSRGSFQKFSPPPSHQPARQFDQTVGRFDTRPNMSSVRSWRTVSRFIASEGNQKDQRLASQPFAILFNYPGRECELESRFGKLQTGVDTCGKNV